MLIQEAFLLIPFMFVPGLNIVIGGLAGLALAGFHGAALGVVLGVAVTAMARPNL